MNVQRQPTTRFIATLLSSLCLLLIFACQQSDDDGWQSSIFPQHVYYPLTKPETMSRGFNPFREHQERMSKLYQQGIDQYELREQGIHRETIYSQGDLSETIDILLKNLLPDRSYQLLPERHNVDQERYELELRYKGTTFHFWASSQNHFLPLQPVLRELNRLAAMYYPGYRFAIPNHPNDHTSIFVFGQKENLRRAMTEGFPCTLDSIAWSVGDWPQANYPLVKLSSIPATETLKKALLERLEVLAAEGKTVPTITPDQLHVTDLAENGLIHIIVNGYSVSLNLIKGQWVYCSNDPWGHLLALCLQEDFSGELLLEDPVRRRWREV